MKTTSTRGATRHAPKRGFQVGKTRRSTKKGYLKRPELGFVDRLLKSFKQVAPDDWIPSQYLALIQERRKQNRKQLH